MNALYAAAEGDLGELKRLLIQGVSPNTSDYDRRTILHLAASEGNYAIVKYLLKYHDVNANARDRWGNTAVDDATRNDREDIVKLLKPYLLSVAE